MGVLVFGGLAAFAIIAAVIFLPMLLGVGLSIGLSKENEISDRDRYEQQKHKGESIDEFLKRSPPPTRISPGLIFGLFTGLGIGAFFGAIGGFVVGVLTPAPPYLDEARPLLFIQNGALVGAIIGAVLYALAFRDE